MFNNINPFKESAQRKPQTCHKSGKLKHIKLYGVHLITDSNQTHNLSEDRHWLLGKEEVFMFFLVHMMWLFTNSNEETNETCVSRFIFFICV
jgi:hypothetical protein